MASGSGHWVGGRGMGSGVAYSGDGNEEGLMVTMYGGMNYACLT